MSALRTTYAMVSDAHDAVLVAEELVEAAGVLLAEAVVDEHDVDLHVHLYKRAKAQRRLANAVYECTRRDWERAREAMSA